MSFFDEAIIDTIELAKNWKIKGCTFWYKYIYFIYYKILIRENGERQKYLSIFDLDLGRSGFHLRSILWLMQEDCSGNDTRTKIRPDHPAHYRWYYLKISDRSSRSIEIFLRILISRRWWSSHLKWKFGQIRIISLRIKK